MLRRLGKRRCRMSLLSWMEAKLLLAMTRVSRLGNMEPNLRTSAHSWRLLSVMWSRRRDGQATLEALTLLYSLRHRNNSSSLQKSTGHDDTMMCYVMWCGMKLLKETDLVCVLFVLRYLTSEQQHSVPGYLGIVENEAPDSGKGFSPSWFKDHSCQGVGAEIKKLQIGNAGNNFTDLKNKMIFFRIKTKMGICRHNSWL